MALVVPGQLALHIICTGAGMVVYATYAKMGCDPVEAGYVTNVNQVSADTVLGLLVPLRFMK